MNSLDFQTLLQFFKVMTNESRLKLVGILAQRECSVEEFANAQQGIYWRLPDKIRQRAEVEVSLANQ